MTPRIQIVQPTATQRERVAREDARIMLAVELRAMLRPHCVAVTLRMEKLAEIIAALEE
jgi:hypothetical protein